MVRDYSVIENPETIKSLGIIVAIGAVCLVGLLLAFWLSTPDKEPIIQVLDSFSSVEEIDSYLDAHAVKITGSRLYKYDGLDSTRQMARHYNYSQVIKIVDSTEVHYHIDPSFWGKAEIRKTQIVDWWTENGKERPIFQFSFVTIKV